MATEPERIEKQSFDTIEEKLREIPLPEREIVKRVIHATADFEFAKLIVFRSNAVEEGIKAVRSGRNIITDVNMVMAGIDRKSVEKHCGGIKCFVDKDEVRLFAERSGKTRASSAFKLFARELDGSIVAVGNAPTALCELCDLMDKGVKPALVIAAPIGFVGAEESKERVLEYKVPAIAVRGVKGGSTVAVAIVNALLKLAEHVVERDGKKMRRGYTTGTCAAAAAKAAASMLFSGKIVEEVSVELPAGESAVFEVQDQEIEENFAKCCIVKDAGDDPDVTNGARICASVKKTLEGIAVKGGDGVGRVTKEGLEVEVGKPAINPVPQRMIHNEVRKIVPRDRGAEITVFVPDGEKLAGRTMNRRLGILGGISIIGTTGIVEPRSEEALKRSLVPQISIALAMGYDELVLTPGNIGEKAAVGRGIPEDAVVQTGNFIGYMLDECVKRGVRKVLIFGSAGKLCKVAAGIFNTHSRVADGRFETIAAHASIFGADRKITKRILKANTTEAALEILRRNNLTEVFDSIAKKASERAEYYTRRKIDASTVLISLKGEIIGRDMERSKWAKYLS